MNFVNEFITNHETIAKVLILLALTQVIYHVVSVLLYALLYVFLFRKDLLRRYGSGSWVVVTGCTDGIGQAFALEFARRGFNIVLVSRSREKLESVARQIASINAKAETRLIVADFCKSYEADFYERIDSQLKDLDISILVNNVGLGHGGNFEEISDAQCREMIYLNVFPIIFMTHHLVPRLLKRSAQQRSAIINLGSQAGKQTAPYLSVYSATKAFDIFFSKAIAYEYSGRIDVLSYNPGSVLTTRTSQMDLPGVITSEDAVNGCLTRLGATNETAGDYRHALLGFLVSILPTFLAEIAFAKTNLDIWKKAQKKQQEKKQQ